MASSRESFNFVRIALSGQVLRLLALGLFVWFCVSLCQHRLKFRRLMMKHGIAIMPHSFIFGHLVTIAKVMMRKKLPPDTSVMLSPLILVREFPEVAREGVLYIDVWPLKPISLIAFQPDMMAQFTQEHSLPKAGFYRWELGPLTGNHDLVSSDGTYWKTWRSIFNPGFSSKNLTTLLPEFLEEVQVMRDRFMAVADAGKVVPLEKMIQKGTVDVIFRAVLGIRLHSQGREEPFSSALQDQVTWLMYDFTPANMVKFFNPWRYVKLWYNNRVMRNLLAPHVERGIRQYASTRGALNGPKTINYLAIKSYMQEVQALDEESGDSLVVDAKFVEEVVGHMKLFIFAGHDTTASTLSFTFSQLARHPQALAALRAEHDALLGTDPADAKARLTAHPELLNQMPYTLAVLKETLRLFPPAATARRGGPDIFLSNPETGRQYPTEDWLVNVVSTVSQRLGLYWERPDEFIPERFLAREGEPLCPLKNTYRPFELGPRNCIGQELARLEMCAILAMTARELDIEPAYAPGAPEVLGEKCYQTMVIGDITGHAKDGFPVRIKRRKI